MKITLTKDADKFLCIIYKDFLQRRKSGLSKSEAKEFDEDYHLTNSDFYQWHQDDIDESKMELGQKGLVHIWMGGSFYIEDNGIIYMESRFKNGLKEMIDIVSKFIP